MHSHKHTWISSPGEKFDGENVLNCELENVAIVNALQLEAAWHTMTLTFDPLTLKVSGRSGVTWS